jgi:catechol 2,3-dioxygenase-like lactoylglutathione lyase family enzyme
MRLCTLLLALTAAAVGDTLPLDGIAHLAFRVSDLSASRAFYEKLGFEQAFEFSDVSYIKINDRQFVELYQRKAASEPLGMMHLCFDTGNIERLRQAYLELGFKPSETAKGRAGNLLFNLRDTENQVIEFSQYLPGSIHSNDRGKHTSERRIAERLVNATAAVKDVAAAQAFYARLGVLNYAALGSQALAEFEVGDAALAADRLRERGLAPKMKGDEVSILDPDGTPLVFTSHKARATREILKLETAALEGWQRGSPDPMLATLDPEVTYVNAATAQLLNGLPAVKELFEKYRGRPLYDSFAILHPLVRVSGDCAVLSYQLEQRIGSMRRLWNGTQVYEHRDGTWRIIHTHWSRANGTED